MANAAKAPARGPGRSHPRGADHRGPQTVRGEGLLRRRNEVVAASGVGTRGALYHHFEDKRALFQAVFEQVEVDLLAAAGSLETATRSDGCARACSVSLMPHLLPRYSAFC